MSTDSHWNCSLWLLSCCDTCFGQGDYWLLLLEGVNTDDVQFSSCPPSSIIIIHDVRLILLRVLLIENLAALCHLFFFWRDPNGQLVFLKYTRATISPHLLFRYLCADRMWAMKRCKLYHYPYTESYQLHTYCLSNNVIYYLVKYWGEFKG